MTDHDYSVENRIITPFVETRWARHIIWAGGGSGCSAINCSNSRKKQPFLSFFRYPKDPERCRKWVVNSRRKNLDKLPPKQLHKSYFLCANHFEDEQFMNASKKSLIHCAVPTLFDFSGTSSIGKGRRKQITFFDPPDPPKAISPSPQISPRKTQSQSPSIPDSQKTITSSRTSPKKIQSPVTRLDFPNPPKTFAPSRPSTRSSTRDNSTPSRVSPSVSITSPESNPNPSESQTKIIARLKKEVLRLKENNDRKDQQIKDLLRKCKNIENHSLRKYESLEQQLSQYVTGTALEFIMAQIMM